MLREELVFGPIYSRRLGSSLGINLLPEKGKLCNFDCIYCECGWNRDGRGDTKIPTAAELETALRTKLEECSRRHVAIDSITFSGDGEPTLNPDFPQIVDITLRLRDRYYPGALVSVLSNATKVSRKAVFDALMRVDNPILKLDAPTEELAQRINQPACDYKLEEILSDLERFEGNFVLQTMFLRAPGFDSSSPDVLGGWMDIVRRLRPRKIMVYTIARETPQAGLEKFTEEEMAALVRPLVDEGFDIQINE